MKFLLALFMFAVTVVWAAPRAANPNECVLYADVAATVRAMAMVDISEPDRARVLGRLYAVQPGADADAVKRMLTIMALINTAAERFPGDAAAFSGAISGACLENAGNMDSVLGRSI